MATPASLHHLDWDALCEAAASRIVSGAAKERVWTEHGSLDRDRILPRDTDASQVEVRLDELDGLAAVLELTSAAGHKLNLGSELSRVEPVAEIVERARRHAELDLGEMCAVADLARAAVRIREWVDSIPTPGDPDSMWETLAEDRQRGIEALRRCIAGLEPPERLAQTLERSIEREPEPALADSASPTLGDLRRRVGRTRRALVSQAERFLREPRMEGALADRYWTERDGRVVLPVRSDAFSRRGGSGTVTGIIHGSSGRGQTLFVEPHGLVDDNNALREAIMDVRAEEHRILARLRAEVGEAADALLACEEALVALDRVRARYRLSEALEGVRPSVVVARQGERLELEDARHPLMLLSGVDVVPNDLRVDVGTALVVSGPNAGGKTVGLKTLGLCVLMAQAGLRVPARGRPRIPCFAQLVTDVGDDQSISANLSTFSAHISHVLEAFAAIDASPWSTLVLLDEVAVGTDPDQGAALAEAILTELVGRGATMVVTTHYERLKLLATREPERFANAAVGFDLERLAPTFRLSMGVPGSSSALAVARRLGLPEPVLAQAESMLSDERLRVDALLREVEAERERLHQQAASLQAEKTRLTRWEQKLDLREARAEETAAAKRKKAHDSAAAALRSLEDEIRTRRKALRKQRPEVDPQSGVTDEDSRAFARTMREKLQGGRGPEPSPPGEPPARIEPGMRVRVESLGAQGEVLGVKGDKVTVQLPLAKVTVSRDDLRLGQEKKKKPQSVRAEPPRRSESHRHFGAEAEPVSLKFDNVVDCRGVRADEAVAMVESFLDRAVAEDTEVVVVQHGYGSGALRRAVREQLPRLPHVRRHRPGLPAEGGDGVTVVWVGG